MEQGDIQVGRMILPASSAVNGYVRLFLRRECITDTTVLGFGLQLDAGPGAARVQAGVRTLQ
jgi:hypothetical protein